MNLSNEYTSTEDGGAVHSCVKLSIDLIGTPEPPFLVQAWVDGCCVYQSNHSTETDAKQRRKEIHGMYMENRVAA